jgi:hypothetical protein
MTHRSRPFPARLLTVSGIAGLVIATAAWAAPTATAATQDSTRAAARAAPSASAAKASTHSCSPDVSKSLQVTPHLSNLRATGQYEKSKKKNPTRIVLALKGSPSLGLHLAFTGEVNCTKSLTAVKIPISGSPLFLKIEPELDFNAAGDVQADFAWTESINVGFTISGDKFTQGAHSLTSTTKVVFTGNGTAGMKLNLEAVIETAGGIVGVQGSVGPDITATVTDDTGSGAACWNGNYTTEASFSVFVNAYFFKKTLSSPTWQLGKKVLFHNCLGG